MHLYEVWTDSEIGKIDLLAYFSSKRKAVKYRRELQRQFKKRGYKPIPMTIGVIEMNHEVYSVEDILRIYGERENECKTFFN